jgi:hypothetical protein
MAACLVSAVAFYGPKAGPLRELLAGVQAMIAEHVADRFLPYTLDQVHATLISLEGVRDPDTQAVVNDYYLKYAGSRRQMDLRQVTDILTRRFRDPLRVRIGGFRPQQEVPFTSRDQHPFERTFSVQGNAFVLMGWPVVSVGGPARPLDELRRDMNDANVRHKYHPGDADVDNDLHMVVGHHAGAPDDALQEVVDAVRAKLAAEPVELDIGLGDVKIVASDSPTLAPSLYVSDIPGGRWGGFWGCGCGGLVGTGGRRRRWRGRSRGRS